MAKKRIEQLQGLGINLVNVVEQHGSIAQSTKNEEGLSQRFENFRAVKFGGFFFLFNFFGLPRMEIGLENELIFFVELGKDEV